MAKRYLLLGAGFSRNWGGWLASEVFEYLLGWKQVDEHPYLRELLWRFKNNGGFEAALADLQRGDSRTQPELQAFQAAISEMFERMNSGFLSPDLRFEFSNNIGSLVRELLVRFDAIFTLNQDLLLERRYMDGNVALTEPRRWSGAVAPGVQLVTPTNEIDPESWRNARWRVRAPPYAVPGGVQPVYKMHGSSQWLDAEGSGMLIVGGGKHAAIKAQPLLNWYQSQFEAALNEGDVRLMVIGYSFADGHIDQMIRSAADKSRLKLFVIDPLGVDVVDRTLGGQIRTGDPLQSSMIGASRRSLREIFGDDRIERTKIMRFFD